MGTIDELIAALQALKLKQDHVDKLWAADVRTIVDGIFAAMDMGGSDIDITTEQIEGGTRVTITDADGTQHSFDVKDGDNAYEVYKSTVPSGVTPMSKADWLASLKGADGAPGNNGHNPCLGRFTTLPTLSPNPFSEARAGDYLYYDTTDSQTSDPVTYIYHFDGTNWDAQGTVVDVSNLTFGSGEEVTDVIIDSTALVNPATNALAKAVDVAEVKDSLMVERDIILSQLLNYSIDNDTADISANSSTITLYCPVMQGDMVHATVGLSVSKAVRYGFSAVEPAAGVHVDNMQLKSGTSIEINIRAEQSGYFVMSHSTLHLTYTNTCTIAKLELPELVKEDLRKTGFYFSDDEDITSVVDGLPLHDMIIGNSGNWASGTGRYHSVLDATGIGTITVTPESGKTAYIAFLKSYQTPVAGNTPDYVGGTTLVNVTEETSYEVPNGAKYIYFNKATSSLTGLATMVKVTGKCYSSASVEETVRIIQPWCSYCTYAGLTGGFYNKNCNRENYSTVRFVAIKDSEPFEIKVSDNRYYRVYFYDKDFVFISHSGAKVAISAGVWTMVGPPAGTKYVKITVSVNQESEVEGSADSTTNLELKGYFDEQSEVYNVRPNTVNGYTNLHIYVNLTNPTACDGETSAAQDGAEYRNDFGLLYLPETYTNTGRPTRLIIYCHGAAVNYAPDVNPNNDATIRQDLEPEYWLAEGYAVMDMEGNPFDNTNEHVQTPQALDCYIAGYKWVIEAFNIHRDGVFVGGRSMGGGMVFGLIRGQSPIPVIAACPNVPATMTTIGVVGTGSQNAIRRKFFALHCGFELPEGYTWDTFDWTQGNNTGDIDTHGTMRNLCYVNWDKLVKNTPILGMTTDLPIDDTAKRALINSFYGTSDERVALWSQLHVIAKCPVKLFGCNQDTTCPPPKTSLLYYRMLINAAQIAECRLFDSTLSGSNAHHYDTQDATLRASVTTRFGEQMSNVPIVYIEMLQFWRRYEQEN